MDLGVKTLPMELVFSCILPKLPAKSLLRFKCVSKSFLIEISSPEFSELFSKANHRLLIVRGDKYQTIGIYELDSPHSPPTFCPYPIPSKWYASSMLMVACCESYLLITQFGCLILLNPTTRIYHIIPRLHIPRNSYYVQYGMCHCSVEFNNDDLKIVRFVVECNYNADSLREVMVYSLRTNSWKLVSETVRTDSIENPVLVQNHLLVMICYGHGDHTMRIGCFDIKAERWSNDVPLSGILLGEIGSNPTRYDHYYLGVLDGKLRFSSFDADKVTYNIWVMKDYGVKESWVKLMSLPAQGPKEIYHPIAYRKGSSDELLLCIPNKSGKYLWYDLRDKQFNETGFNGEGLDGSDYSFAYICKGSLLNFPGGQLIRSSSKKQEDEEMEVEEEEEDDDDYYGIQYHYAELH